MKSSTKKNKSTDQLTKDQLVKLYREMLLIRRFEEKAGQLYGLGLIGGFCHLYIGQEAVVVGLNHLIKHGDAMITSYRDHGHIIALGVEAKFVMAELMGKATGCSKGKGGSMHMFDTAKHFYGGHGIVGAQVPLGTGIAFTNKYKGNDNICLTYYGDGAAHQGQVYESFNMAKLWNLPVIYIVENNHYAMGTSVSRSTFSKELYRRGESFGIPGVKINGMDIFSVITEGKKVVDHVRSGNGPMIIEMDTYRYRGHSMSDPAKYRTKEEVTNMRESKDPIEGLKKYMLDNKYSDETYFEQMEKEIKNIINECVEFSKSSPEPDLAELYTDIYTEEN